MPIRVVLADDHGVLRAGLRALLNEQPDIEVIGEADSAESALALAHDLVPEIIVLDVRMPGDGLVAAESLKKELPQIKVLILSQYDDPAYLNQAMSAGASGYALKRSSGQELIQAIRAIADGEVYLHPAIARILVQQSWKAKSEPEQIAPQALSEREKQVLKMVALGHTTQQIGEQLFLSVRTVETYKMRGMEKLGLSGRAALVRYVLGHNMLETEQQV